MWTKYARWYRNCLLCNGVVRSAPFTCHPVTQRLSLASSALSVREDCEATNNGGELSASGGGFIDLCAMSNREKLTFVNFCITNLASTCFYSLLGPFFPTEVQYSSLSVHAAAVSNSRLAADRNVKPTSDLIRWASVFDVSSVTDRPPRTTANCRHIADVCVQLILS